MVYDALANILKARVVEALVDDRRRPGSAVIEGFGDLVVLVNRAFEACNPFWVVRASDEAVHGHSGFFTNAYVDFVRGVVLEAVSVRTRQREATFSAAGGS